MRFSLDHKLTNTAQQSFRPRVQDSGDHKRVIKNQMLVNNSTFHMGSLRLQPKLKINPPNDAYEQEADRIAQKVVQMKEVPSIQGNGKTAIHRKPLADEISQLGDKTAQRKCSKCKSEEEEYIQRKSSNANVPQISSSFTDQLSATQGGGNSLDSTTNAFMSSRFGFDFSHVRIHNDSKAHAMSQGIQAKAFTRGTDIYFDQGTYAPNTQEGRELLAHELVHTVQQESGIQRNPWDNPNKINAYTPMPFSTDLIEDPLVQKRLQEEALIRTRIQSARARMTAGVMDDEDMKHAEIRNMLTGLKTAEVDTLITKIKAHQKQRDEDIKNDDVKDPSKKVAITTAKLIEWLEVRKVVSTPMPSNAKVKRSTSNTIRGFTIDLGETAITVKNDTTSSKGNATGVKTNFTGSFTWMEVNGKITRLKKNGSNFNPTQLEVTIQTKHENDLDETSAYGKGTTEEDKKNKTTTLRVHEGQHGTDFLDYLTKKPLPASLKNGVNGQLTPDEFKSILRYVESISDESCELTDQTGFSQADYLETEEGKASGIKGCSP